MATSNVSICNLALQKLGAARIAALDEASKNARECNACFEAQRDRELRANRWKFAITRVTLAPSATIPDFFYAHAFLLPSDCLRPIFPPIYGLDWKVELHTGVPAILTNFGDTLELRYVARITDATVFDALFVEALACKIAWHLCEAITQSNSKKQAVQSEYVLAMREARKMNAIEIGVQISPPDEWLLARQQGQLINSEWRQE
ncbi:MAG: hypothetical protein ACREXT_00670 [Gammaproteobacteria bacterium]